MPRSPRSTDPHQTPSEVTFQTQEHGLYGSSDSYRLELWNAARHSWHSPYVGVSFDDFGPANNYYPLVN